MKGKKKREKLLDMIEGESHGGDKLNYKKMRKKNQRCRKKLILE